MGEGVFVCWHRFDSWPFVCAPAVVSKYLCGDWLAGWERLGVLVIHKDLLSAVVFRRIGVYCGVVFAVIEETGDQNQVCWRFLHGEAWGAFKKYQVYFNCLFGKVILAGICRILVSVGADTYWDNLAQRLVTSKDKIFVNRGGSLAVTCDQNWGSEVANWMRFMRQEPLWCARLEREYLADEEVAALQLCVGFHMGFVRDVGNECVNSSSEDL